jgi:hypothetical protein
MCGLVEAAIGIGVANAAVGVASQATAANEQNDYRRRLGISQNRAYRENAAAVIKDVGLQVDQLARREIEQANATQNELSNIARSVREASATARTQQAAVGVEGVSADLLHLQFERDVAEFESTAMRNVRNFHRQSNMEAQAIYARGPGAINSGYPNPLPPAATINPFASIMNGITSGISVYGALSSFQGPPGIAASAGATTNINQSPILSSPAPAFNPIQSGYSYGGGISFA